MHNKYNDEDMGYLMEVIASINDPKDCGNFFDDLCTIQELKSMAQRLKVAKMLTQGKVYGDIAAETGASSTTISRVNKCLLYGKNGYKKVFEMKE